MEQVREFNEHEIQRIVQEFEYYNQKQEGDNKDDPFLEQELQTTQNSIFKNQTTKSIILAPFNSTKSHISDNFYLEDSIQELLLPQNALVFGDKTREVNR